MKRGDRDIVHGMLLVLTFILKVNNAVLSCCDFLGMRHRLPFLLHLPGDLVGLLALAQRDALRYCEDLYNHTANITRTLIVLPQPHGHERVP